jgi:hypothetical protein
LVFENVGYGNSLFCFQLAILINPYFFFNRAKASAQIQFTPVLRGYITSDYQENAVMRGQVSSPILFNEDLVQLEESTLWRITYNSGSGAFEIKKED